MAAKEHRISVAQRDTQGSTVSRRQRRNGSVPAVIFGRNTTPVSVSVSQEDAEALAHVSHVLTLCFGEAGKERFAIVSDFQRNALSQRIVHVDFHEVKMNEAVTTEVPVELVGTAAPGGGVVELLMHEIRVKCLPGNLPEVITISIAGMAVGDHVTIADLQLPAGVVPENYSPERVVVTVVAPHVAEETTAGKAAGEVEVIGKTKEGA